MFENLSDKLQRAFKNLRGQGTITEENIGDALREIGHFFTREHISIVPLTVREIVEESIAQKLA